MADTTEPKQTELYVVYHQDANDPSKMNITLYGECVEGQYYEFQVWSRAKAAWVPLWTEGPIPAGKTSLDYSIGETGGGIILARWVIVTPAPVAVTPPVA